MVGSSALYLPTHMGVSEIRGTSLGSLFSGEFTSFGVYIGGPLNHKWGGGGGWEMGHHTVGALEGGRDTD